MIVLRVLSYNGAAADGPSAQFDELGGTIGRAENNQLVLPDPERTISRVHARVVFRAGGYAVVDNGSNPISVNGQPVGAGREQPLKPGDELQIGGYLLKAAAAETAAASGDPFADLFGDAAMGLAVPPPVAAQAPAFAPAPAPAPTPALGAASSAPAPAQWAAAAAATSWGAPAPSPPWAPPPPSRPPSASPAPAPAPSLAAGALPEDWDLFAPEPPAGAALPLAAGLPPGDAFAELPRGSDESLDELFGLGSAGQAAAPAGLPAEDAWQLLEPTAQLKPATRSDHASELNLPMSLPSASRPPSPASLQAQPPAQTQIPSPLPTGAVFSWNDPPRDGRLVTLPGARRETLAGDDGAATDITQALQAPQAVQPPQQVVLRPSMPATAGPAPARADAPAGADTDALLAALHEGLAVPGLRLAVLTPETLRLLGQLLRESVHGTVQLLVARAALKREMRAEMTMIVQRENNPLKFSPTVEVALQHLLNPPTPGFMAAAPAVRDAFDDLRAHQMGVMAGMRAALEGVLKRFDPQHLEAKLTRKSAIASLIPATRKARLWELFQELFSQLQTEAEDDFDELFGKAFLRAYEEQLDGLQREPK